MTGATSFPYGVELAGGQGFTVDDLAGLPSDLYYELILGRLVLPGPLEFVYWLGCRLDDPGTIYVVGDLSASVFQPGEFQPDVVVTRHARSDRFPASIGAVLLAVEMTPTDRSRLHASAGIPAYWAIDPSAEDIAFTEYVLGPEGEYQRRSIRGGCVELEQPWPVTLDLDAWNERRREVGW